MKVELTARHHGVHKLVREAEIPGEFSDYATPLPPDGPRRDEYAINEDALLAALPGEFLPVPAKRVLLAVTDEHGGTGQRGLSRFRDWAKYFDAYTLNLCQPETARSATRA